MERAPLQYLSAKRGRTQSLVVLLQRHRDGRGDARSAERLSTDLRHGTAEKSAGLEIHSQVSFGATNRPNVATILELIIGLESVHYSVR